MRAMQIHLRPRELDVDEREEHKIDEFWDWSLRTEYGVHVRDYYQEHMRICQHETLAKYGGTKRLLDAILFSKNEDLHSSSVLLSGEARVVGAIPSKE